MASIRSNSGPSWACRASAQSDSVPWRSRPKGSPNKISRDLKEAYLMAANLAGGKEGLVGYLLQQARQGNPSPFMTGLSKLIPHQVDAKVDASIIVEVVKFTDAADA